MARRFERAGYLLPALIVLIAVVLYPVVYATRISFFRTLIGMPWAFSGLENFGRVIQDPLFQQSVINTVIYMVTTVTVTFVLGFGLAMLVQSISKGKAFFTIAFIVPMAMAPMAVALLWRWMFNPLFGLVNWLFGMIRIPPQTWLSQARTAMAVVMFVDIWQWYPLVFLILLAGLQSLPREPFEAARVDGASPIYIFRRLTLPMLKPVILVALLLRTIDTFRVFDNIYILTGGGPGDATETLSVYVYHVAFTFNNLGQAAAASQIMLLGIGVVSALFFRLLYEEKGR